MTGITLDQFTQAIADRRTVRFGDIWRVSGDGDSLDVVCNQACCRYRYREMGEFWWAWGDMVQENAVVEPIPDQQNPID